MLMQIYMNCFDDKMAFSIHQLPRPEMMQLCESLSYSPGAIALEL